MGNWINLGNDCFNLDKFVHIWMDKTINGFFVMGELENGEEVVLSGCFQCPIQCSSHMYKITSG